MPHIAFLSTLALPTRKDAKGGAEVWSSLMLSLFSKKGYTFDLFAAEDSMNIPGKVTLHPITPPLFPLMNSHPFFTEYIPHHANLPAKEYFIDYIGSVSLRLQQQLIKNSDKYDFIIDNSGASVVGTNWDLFPKPVIVIANFGESAPNISLFQLLPIPKNIHFVFLTQIQYDNAYWIPQKQKSVIPHGICTEDFVFSYTSLDSLTWMGRVTPEKGLEDAIAVANTLKKDLTIFGYKQSVTYFAEKIQPLMTVHTHLVENNYENKHHNTCKALLFPIHWEEPFGIAAVEALACGTPVIAYARGSMPEIIQDGDTGFLVNPSDTDTRGNFITQKTGTAGLIEATQRLYALSEKEYATMRLAARKHVEAKYTVKHMAGEYEKLFQKIVTA